VKKDIVYQFGLRVRALRKAHNLTQEQLAGASGISLKYIQRIEGKTPPNLGLEYLEKLSIGFDIPLHELLKI
jgi:transcriptional regulator with XRE-family HTH domain